MRSPIWIDAIGCVGPGLPDWPTTAAVLRGEQPFSPSDTAADSPSVLPPAERRRTCKAVRLALAAGIEAVRSSTHDASTLASIFSSSGGDGENCHAICEALAGSDRLISPTRFHNSVHNASSGYWGIGMQARPASTSLCAHDASFAAGLIEAAAWIHTRAEPVILVAYDARYPKPLLDVRPIAHDFALALILAPRPAGASSIAIRLSLERAPLTRMDEPGLESLRAHVPTARALPLLQALARNQHERSLHIEYLPATGARARIAEATRDSRAAPAGTDPNCLRIDILPRESGH